MRFHITATVEYPNGVAPGKDQLERVRKNLIARLSSGTVAPIHVIAMTVEAKPPMNEAYDRGPSVFRRCQCELNHDVVGRHPAFHGHPANPSCQNVGTERLQSDYGAFMLCPPCADDALYPYAPNDRTGSYYQRART